MLACGRLDMPLLLLVLLVVIAPESSRAAAGEFEIPHPLLDALEPDVQQHIREIVDRLDATLVETASPAERLEAYGEVGRLYFLYDFPAASRAAFLAARALAEDDFRWHYYLAALARLEGDSETVVESLERALQLRPGDVPALTRLADAQLELGDLDEAEATYREAGQRDPSSAAVQYGLGRVAEYRRRFAEAIPYFEKALELQPGATAIHYRLGLAYREVDRLDEARHHLGLNRGDRVRMTDPLIDQVALMIQGEEIYFKAGIDAARRGDLEEAVALFERAAAENPDDAQVHYNLALAFSRLDRQTEARAALERSITADPEFRNGHFNLAVMMVEDSDYAAAEVHFGRAHEIDPEDVESHLEWATALARIGRDGKAVEELESLVERVPSAADGRYRLAVLLERGGQDGEAIEHYQEAVALQPDLTEAHASLGMLLGREGRFLDAANEFAAVVEHEPQRLDAHMGQAMALVLGSYDAEARRRLEASLEAHPGDVELSQLLARVLAASTEPQVRDGARSLQLARTVMQRAQTVEHAQTVAMALAELGRFDEAVALQRQVVAQLGGSESGAAAARRRLELYRRGEPCRAPWRDG